MTATLTRMRAHASQPKAMQRIELTPETSEHQPLFGHQIVWASSSSDFRAVRNVLRWHVAAKLAAASNHRGGSRNKDLSPVCVGVDCEWTFATEDTPWAAHVPALIQLCLKRTVWLLDVHGVFDRAARELPDGAEALGALRHLLTDLFNAPLMPVRSPAQEEVAKPACVVLGFSFKEDLVKLRNIFTVDPATGRPGSTDSPMPRSAKESPRIVDVQRAALGRQYNGEVGVASRKCVRHSWQQPPQQQHAWHWQAQLKHTTGQVLDYGAYPSLRRVAEDTLGASMDKSQQRSNWVRAVA